ncbi:MAG: ribosome silencing factor [Chloroflexi bacterium]|nr:ribosome silencing factor [Chloroflexota bacterium]
MEKATLIKAGDTGAELTSKQRAEFVAEAADDKRAVNIVTLDLQGITLVADFFVICSGTSDVHVRAVSDGIEEDLKKKHGVRPYAVQGRGEANWIILDYGDVVAHVFSEAEREYYDLESFWKHEQVVQRVLAGRPGDPSDEDESEDDFEDETGSGHGESTAAAPDRTAAAGIISS